MSALSMDSDGFLHQWKRFSDIYDVPPLTPIDKLERLSYQVIDILYRLTLDFRQLLDPEKRVEIILLLRNMGILNLSYQEFLDIMWYFMIYLGDFDYVNLLEKRVNLFKSID